jgi:hypothetical protein
MLKKELYKKVCLWRKLNSGLNYDMFKSTRKYSNPICQQCEIFASGRCMKVDKKRYSFVFLFRNSINGSLWKIKYKYTNKYEHSMASRLLVCCLGLDKEE